jgi:hypothetical protein
VSQYPNATGGSQAARLFGRSTSKKDAALSRFGVSKCFNGSGVDVLTFERWCSSGLIGFVSPEFEKWKKQSWLLSIGE